MTSNLVGTELIADRILLASTVSGSLACDMNQYEAQLKAVVTAIDAAIVAVERAVLAVKPETGVTRYHLVTLDRAHATLSEVASELRLLAGWPEKCKRIERW